jgi:hypothetical protein
MLFVTFIVHFGSFSDDFVDLTCNEQHAVLCSFLGLNPPLLN